MIHYNISCPHIDESFFIGLFDVIGNILVFLPLMGYIIALSTEKIRLDLVIPEFVLSMFYATILALILFFLIILISVAIYQCMRSTAERIDQRDKGCNICSKNKDKNNKDDEKDVLLDNIVIKNIDDDIMNRNDND
jgi:hypothetical protein